MNCNLLLLKKKLKNSYRKKGKEGEESEKGKGLAGNYS